VSDSPRSSSYHSNVPSALLPAAGRLEVGGRIEMKSGLGRVVLAGKEETIILRLIVNATSVATDWLNYAPWPDTLTVTRTLEGLALTTEVRRGDSAALVALWSVLTTCARAIKLHDMFSASCTRAVSPGNDFAWASSFEIARLPLNLSSYISEELRVFFNALSQGLDTPLFDEDGTEASAAGHLLIEVLAQSPATALPLSLGSFRRWVADSGYHWSAAPEPEPNPETTKTNWQVASGQILAWGDTVNRPNLATLLAIEIAARLRGGLGLPPLNTMSWVENGVQQGRAVVAAANRIGLLTKYAGILTEADIIGTSEPWAGVGEPPLADDVLGLVPFADGHMTKLVAALALFSQSENIAAYESAVHVEGVANELQYSIRWDAWADPSGVFRLARFLAAKDVAPEHISPDYDEVEVTVGHWELLGALGLFASPTLLQAISAVSTHGWQVKEAADEYRLLLDEHELAAAWATLMFPPTLVPVPATWALADVEVPEVLLVAAKRASKSETVVDADWIVMNCIDGRLTTHGLELPEADLFAGAVGLRTLVQMTALRPSWDSFLMASLRSVYPASGEVLPGMTHTYSEIVELAMSPLGPQSPPRQFGFQKKRDKPASAPVDRSKPTAEAPIPLPPPPSPQRSGRNTPDPALGEMVRFSGRSLDDVVEVLRNSESSVEKIMGPAFAARGWELVVANGTYRVAAIKLLEHADSTGPREGLAWLMSAANQLLLMAILDGHPKGTQLILAPDYLGDLPKR